MFYQYRGIDELELRLFEEMLYLLDDDGLLLLCEYEKGNNANFFSDSNPYVVNIYKKESKIPHEFLLYPDDRCLSIIKGKDFNFVTEFAKHW
jgi:hypothetical protein